MFRTAVLRSTAAAVRSATRPISNNAARRLAIGVAAPRVSVFSVPKVAAWQSVRCYALTGGLDRKDVYDRIKQLLANFDKVNDPTNVSFPSPEPSDERDLPQLLGWI
jgi:NADH dehydrogenase (ubiquinone) 1 alpha/beta subcomplex 1